MFTTLKIKATGNRTWFYMPLKLSIYQCKPRRLEGRSSVPKVLENGTKRDDHNSSVLTLILVTLIMTLHGSGEKMAMIAI